MCDSSIGIKLPSKCPSVGATIKSTRQADIGNGRDREEVCHCLIQQSRRTRLKPSLTGRSRHQVTKDLNLDKRNTEQQ